MWVPCGVVTQWWAPLGMQYAGVLLLLLLLKTAAYRSIQYPPSPTAPLSYKRVREGNFTVRERGHTLVLGHNAQLHSLLRQIAVAQEERGAFPGGRGVRGPIPMPYSPYLAWPPMPHTQLLFLPAVPGAQRVNTGGEGRPAR